MKNIIRQLQNGKGRFFLEKPSDPLHGRQRLVFLEYATKARIQDKKILDVGSGSGWSLYNYKKAGAREVVGLEVDLASYQQLKDFYEETPNVSVYLHADDLLKSYDQEFDYITLWEVLEHLPRGQEKHILKRMCSLLKPGGSLIISTPYYSFFGCFLDPAWYFGHRHYSKNELIDIFEEIGVELIKSDVRFGFLTVIDTLNLYISKWLLWRSRLFERESLGLLDKDLSAKYQFHTLFAEGKKR